MKFQLSFLLVFLTFTMIKSQDRTLDNTSSPNTENSPQEINPNKGKKAIRLLKEGTLIVRLSIFPEKIKHLEKVEGKERAQYEQDRIDQANKDMISEFKKDYDFSQVVFTYGAELDAFLKNEKKDIFLNDNLEFDPNIKLKEGLILLLATKSTTNFILCDINLKQITKPNLEYICHHMDKGYHTGVDAGAQEFRELISKDRTAAGLNKKLHFYTKSKSLFTLN